MRKWMQEKREERKLTQQNVADKLGISKQYYQMIETGERQKNLNTSIVMSLASCFDMSPVEIINLETTAENGEALC